MQRHPSVTDFVFLEELAFILHNELCGYHFFFNVFCVSEKHLSLLIEFVDMAQMMMDNWSQHLKSSCRIGVNKTEIVTDTLLTLQLRFCRDTKDDEPVDVRFRREENRFDANRTQDRTKFRLDLPRLRREVEKLLDLKRKLRTWHEYLDAAEKGTVVVTLEEFIASK